MSARVVLASLIFALAALLVGCANTQLREVERLTRDGRLDEASSRLEQALREDPGNAEIRIALITNRSMRLNRSLALAETARREGRWTDAEKAFRQAQAIEPENALARQGLAATAMERRHRAALSEIEPLVRKGAADDLNAASELLRPVLAEDPQSREARAMRARIEEARAKLPRADPRLSDAYRKPITLEFRDTPLRAVFDFIAKASGLNFFFDKDIRPDLRTTIFARNTTIEDAVRLLLVTQQLEQRVLNANSVLIFPNTPPKLKEYQALSVRAFHLTNADVKAVSNTLKTLLKVQNMVVDERLGMILLRDTPEVIRLAERLVALQDQGEAEVMLEVEVLEVKRSRLNELGVQWPAQLTLSPLQSATSPLTLSALRNLTPSTTGASIGNLVINARSEDQDANLLANPRIRVKNREKAKILIGDRVPVITSTSTSTGFVSESINYVEVGLKLEVEPSIYLDDEVAIKVNLEVSNLVREVLSKAGSLSYQIGTRNASTALRLKDGETQILAGLISDEDRTSANKVPGVGSLPVVGRLLGTQKDDSQRNEILLSITPRLLRNLQRPELALAEFESGTDSSVGSALLSLGRGDNAADAAVPTPASGAAQPTVLPSAPQQRNALATTGSTVSAVPPLAGGTATPPVPPTGGVRFSWQVPSQVRVGEQFTAVLMLESQPGLRGLPLLLAFDPAALQLAGVQEGDFLRQRGGTTNFSHRADPAQGRVFTAAVRTGSASAEAVNGSGSVLSLVFKAIKPGATRVQLLSASPEPAPAVPLPLPLDRQLQVLP